MSLYPSDALYLVRIHCPNGDVLEPEIWASDSQEAQILAAEQLMKETGLDFDVVASWVGTAERIRRSA